MDLLGNAVTSITNGVDDYLNGGPTRITSSIRNIFAGVLLLLKEKLRQASPAGSNDALIYARIKPQYDAGGNVVLVGDGKTTVDFNTIHQRFKDLDLTVDWKRLEKLQKMRNSIEHGEVTDSHAVLQEAVADTFSIVAEVFKAHLNLDAFEHFDEVTWQAMIANADAQKKLEEHCKTTRESLKDVPDQVQDSLINSASCPLCSSSLIEATTRGAAFAAARFACQACGEDLASNDLIEGLIEVEYSWQDYRAVKDGGDASVATCPFCDLKAYIVPDNVCLACGESAGVRECAICGEPLGLDDIDEELCGYHRYVMDKDD